MSQTKHITKIMQRGFLEVVTVPLLHMMKGKVMVGLDHTSSAAQRMQIAAEALIFGKSLGSAGAGAGCSGT